MIGSVEATRAQVERPQAEHQVERILQSKVFRASEVLRHLFSYLAGQSLSGTAGNLKEYTIGLDALGKPSSFDPRQESVVRMHAARLRQKLAEYYRTEGKEDPVIVDLPKGGFKLTFEQRPALFPPAEAPVTRWRRKEILLAISLAAAILCAAYFAARLSRVERAESGVSSAWTPELRELWEPLLSSSQPLVVCIATPLFVRIPGFGFVRESSTNDWDDVPGSKKITAVEGALKTGMAQPSYSYTGVGTASGAFLLGQFLTPRRQAVLLTRANLLSWPELTQNNVVFLGPMAGIHQTEDIPMDQQIVLDSTGIRNLKPRPGEPAFIADQPSPDGEESGVSHALISRIPGMNGHGTILMLAGNQISSVMGGVQAFTNPSLAQMLVSRMRTSAGGVPRYFQVVLKVRSMDNVPIEISYMFHRELSVPAPSSGR